VTTILLVRALRSRIGPYLPRLPNGRVDALRQVALFVFADLCYETVRGVAEGQRAEAFTNGQNVIDIEKSMHLFFEPHLQSLFLPARWVIDLANFSYMNTHFVLTLSFLIWLYLYRNEHFYFVRNMFMVAMGLAIVGYTLVPTAPPRLFPQEGFVDTITQYAQVNHDSALVKVFINPYAAIPSMHCAFALMVGGTGALIARHTITRAFWCVYPFFVFFVVIVTANHFWIDGAVGALVAVLSALTASTVLARARPEAWSWRQQPATA
jgi:PAP2 superfamily